MRRAVLVLLLLLVGTAWGQTEIRAVTTDRWAVSGASCTGGFLYKVTVTVLPDMGSASSSLICPEGASAVDFVTAQADGGLTAAALADCGVPCEGLEPGPWVNIGGSNYWSPGQVDLRATLGTPEPPDVVNDPGWEVWDDLVECPGGIFAHRAHFWNDETVTYDVSWSTPCGGSYYGLGLTGAEREAQLDAFEAACDEVCSDPRDDWGEDPEPPDPFNPGDPQECIGLEGLACESTLQDIRELLGRMYEGESQAAPQPFPDQVAEGDPYAPPYDASQPNFETWTAPEILEADVLGLVDLIDARAAAVVSAAEGRLPFGLMGWVPQATLTGTAACVNPSWTMLRATQEIGWCGSAPEAWLSSTGRALSLVVATFAFGFGVVRTVAWA